MIWRRQASTSGTTQGVALEVTTVGSNVAYFGPLDRHHGTSAELVIADAATGRVRASTPRLQWTSTPHACDRAAADPCATSYQPGPEAEIEFRLNVRDRSLQVVPGVRTGHREIGDQLVDPLVRDPERIERRVKGRTVWTRYLSTLFGPRTTTDSGWNFERYGATYAGTVFANQDPYTERRTLTIDLARDPVSAGFRAKDGSLIWQRRGTSIDCNSTLHVAAATTRPVRCSYAGSMTYHTPPPGGGGSTRVTTSGLAVTGEGFDPATGGSRGVTGWARRRRWSTTARLWCCAATTRSWCTSQRDRRCST